MRGAWFAAAALATCGTALGTAGAPTELARAAKRDLALNLTNAAWQVTSFDDVALTGIAYSAAGWDVDPKEEGCTCRLSAVLTDFDAQGNPVYGDSTVVTNGLTGRGTLTWDISSGFRRRVYRLVHEVMKGATADASRTLGAFFSLTDCGDIPDSYEDLYDGAVGDSEKLTLVNDATRPWRTLGDAGAGIRTGNVPEGNATSFSFVSDRPGTFAYDYALEGGVAEVFFDGVKCATLAESPDWTAGDALRMPSDRLTGHTVTFTFTPTADGGALRLKNVALVTDKTASFASSRKGEYRLVIVPTNGWYVAKEKSEIGEFRYSCTNWTGCAGTSDTSETLVSTVPLSGVGLSAEEQEDLWSWTEGPVRETYRRTGEGSFRWKARQGVWKVKMAIVTGSSTNHVEEVIFDLRKLAGGFMISIQ